MLFRPIQPDFSLFCKYLFLVWLRKLLKFVTSSFFHIEITAACAGSQRSSSSELQAWKVAVAAVIIGAEYFCQLRAAKGRKVFDIWTGDDIHAEFALLFWIENILKATFRFKHLSGHRIPGFDEQAFHSRYFHQLCQHPSGSQRISDSSVFDHSIGGFGNPFLP